MKVCDSSPKQAFLLVVQKQAAEVGVYVFRHEHWCLHVKNQEMQSFKQCQNYCFLYHSLKW